MPPLPSHIRLIPAPPIPGEYIPHNWPDTQGQYVRGSFTDSRGVEVHYLAGCVGRYAEFYPRSWFAANRAAYVSAMRVIERYIEKLHATNAKPQREPVTLELEMTSAIAVNTESGQQTDVDIVLRTRFKSKDVARSTGTITVSGNRVLEIEPCFYELDWSPHVIDWEGHNA